MGDIAEMMLDGTLDCETGEFIDGDSPGYPRTGTPRRRHQRNKKRTAINGVVSFLQRRGIKSELHVQTIENYLIFNKADEELRGKTLEEKAAYIQKDFDHFYKWFTLATKD